MRSAAARHLSENTEYFWRRAPGTYGVQQNTILLKNRLDPGSILLKNQRSLDRVALRDAVTKTCGSSTLEPVGIQLICGTEYPPSHAGPGTPTSRSQSPPRPRGGGAFLAALQQRAHDDHITEETGRDAEQQDQSREQGVDCEMFGHLSTSGEEYEGTHEGSYSRWGREGSTGRERGRRGDRVGARQREAERRRRARGVRGRGRGDRGRRARVEGLVDTVESELSSGL
ncbi:hypothetical protein DFH09DRAFT_1080590 [Mycena vulgaris]|nr:hypothetical protein DFH09DRAFT_1080590 [Mycena vulgaris]